MENPLQIQTKEIDDYRAALLGALDKYYQERENVSEQRKKDIEKIKDGIASYSEKAKCNYTNDRDSLILLDEALTPCQAFCDAISRFIRRIQWQTGWWVLETGNSRLRDNLLNKITEIDTPKKPCQNSNMQLIEFDNDNSIQLTKLNDAVTSLLRVIESYELLCSKISNQRIFDYQNLKGLIEDYKTNSCKDLKAVLNSEVQKIRTGFFGIETGRSQLVLYLSDASKVYFPGEQAQFRRRSGMFFNAFQTTLTNNNIDNGINESEHFEKVIGLVNDSKKNFPDNVNLSYLINHTDRHDSTLLHYAVRAGNLTACKKLVAAGCSVNQADSIGNTPLHVAYMADYNGIADYLISVGAFQSAKNDDRETPQDISKRKSSTSSPCNYNFNSRLSM